MKNKTNKIITLIVFNSLFLISFNGYGQDRDVSKFRFGLQLQKVQNDFGFGIHILSPTFWGDFRLKSAYNLSFLTHLNDDGLSLWTPYSNLNFGTRYKTTISNKINLYVEAGPQMLISPSVISSENLNFGGYGIFGFEFFLNEQSTRSASYFFELGAAGNNSRADNVNRQPKIANGFMTTVGFRF